MVGVQYKIITTIYGAPPENIKTNVRVYVCVCVWGGGGGGVSARPTQTDILLLWVKRAQSRT